MGNEQNKPTKVQHVPSPPMSKLEKEAQADAERAYQARIAEDPAAPRRPSTRADLDRQRAEIKRNKKIREDMEAEEARKKAKADQGQTETGEPMEDQEGDKGETGDEVMDDKSDKDEDQDEIMEDDEGDKDKDQDESAKDDQERGQGNDEARDETNGNKGEDGEDLMATDDGDVPRASSAEEDDDEPAEGIENDDGAEEENLEQGEDADIGTGAAAAVLDAFTPNLDHDHDQRSVSNASAVSNAAGGSIFSRLDKLDQKIDALGRKASFADDKLDEILRAVKGSTGKSNVDKLVHTPKLKSH